MTVPRIGSIASIGKVAVIMPYRKTSLRAANNRKIAIAYARITGVRKLFLIASSQMNPKVPSCNGAAIPQPFLFAKWTTKNATGTRATATLMMR